MFSPLAQMLIDDHGYALIDETNVDDFLNKNTFSVLFFTGDAARLAESDDVAVILPQLVAAFGGRFVPGVVARGETEKQLQRRFRFNTFPTLVFLKFKDYLGVISRVQDWQDYLRDIGEILAREPSAPPPFKFPQGCYPATKGNADTTTASGAPS